MALEEKAKRARSDDQKAHRQADILLASRELIDESGFDGVTMSALAKKVGLAKGTLYLYVRTKEELFLLLFIEAMEEVVEKFRTNIKPGIGVDQLARDMTQMALSIPLFLPLYARLVAVIEANVADEPLFHGKRRLIELRLQFGMHLAYVMQLGADMAEPVTRALMLVLQGAAQFDLSSERANEDLPEDMQEAFQDHGFARNFEPSARLILQVAKT